MQCLPPALEPLSAYNQFILVHLVKNGDRIDKIPIHPIDMTPCDAHNPAHWLSAQVAIDTAEMLGPEYLSGFVFTANDLFWFLDIDHCINQQGNLNEIANELTNLFAGCAIEISQSGTGLHIFGTGMCPPHTTRNNKLGLEFYTEKRFVALTGNMRQGSGSAKTPTEMPGFCLQYFPSPTTSTNLTEWTTVPVPEWKGPADDAQLITKMLSSQIVKQAFGGGCTFADLWNVNIPVLSVQYPDPERDYDASAADAGLAIRLAFWTGKNCDRIERLMRKSGLMRDKWDRRERGLGYLRTTIIKAASRCESVLGGSKLPPPSPPLNDLPPLPPPPDGKTGFQLLTPENQVEHFKGCTYIRDIHRVLVPDGSFLKQEQFRVQYGGYLFGLDSMGQKTTKNAWEAFTESQAVKFPKVTTSSFRPLLKPGAIFDEEGRSVVNTYVAINTDRKIGDPGLWLEWFEKILPDADDRLILMSWMASMVQNPGLKFQWAFVLQGMQGNGKTIITNTLAHSVGWRYTHLPKASDLSGNGLKFNAWMLNKLLIIIEEIYTSERYYLMNDLKPLTTEMRQEIQAKGQDQVVAHCPFNMGMMTNFKDAVKTDYDQRRYAVFYTAQQSVFDLSRDGMTGNYFPKLYKWLRTEGYAIMNNYLRKFKVQAEYDPAKLSVRAPITSSTIEAVALSLGSIEQEIVDAIEEGRPGFADGWVSTIMLNRLLDKLRATSKIPQNKRRDMMAQLGYEWHPSLKDGRVNNPIFAENGKPKLFIKRNHISRNIQTAADVVKAYSKAQNYTPGELVVDDNVKKV